MEEYEATLRSKVAPQKFAESSVGVYVNSANRLLESLVTHLSADELLKYVRRREFTGQEYPTVIRDLKKIVNNRGR